MSEGEVELISFQFFFQLLYLFAILDLIDENLSRLKTGNVMFIDNQSGVPRDVSRDLLLAFLVDEAAETANVDVVPVRHGTLYYAKECFHGCRYIGFVHPSLFCDFINNVCFGHCVIFLVRVNRKFTGGQI